MVRPLLAFGLLLSLALFPSWSVPQTPAQKPTEQLPEAPPLRVEVNVVNVLATVKDSKGRLITDLSRDDFTVYEDGQRQEIRYFSRETALPLTLGLLVDTSVSQERVLGLEQEAASIFLSRVLRSQDLAFVISFDVNVDLLHDFTNQISALDYAIRRTRINAPSRTGPVARGPRGTRLYDAVYLAANEKLKSEVGRKAIILLTDGEDAGSQLRLADAVEAAQRSDTIIYAIAIIDREFYFFGGAGFSGDSVLRKIAEETGGRVFVVDRARDVDRAFAQIAEELRSQYSLGYTPTNVKHDGGFRKLKIKLGRDGLRVQARHGYYAARD